MDTFMKTIVLFITFAMANVSTQDISVETDVGTIVGEVYRGSFNSTPFTVSQFLGIPFAEPPIGNRRFRKPVMKNPFTEPLIAKTIPPQCAQSLELLSDGFNSSNAVSEDCLFLNILVPGSAVNNSDRKAVMIWIYGGGFQVGSQDMYTSPTFAAMNNIILVTLNYRVSVFGFISTGESNLLGNYGLWDQHMAIKWVHDHIDDFGGDPMRITIFGESAGAASVVYQALYDGNQGLFQRVIAQSGSSNLYWSSSDRPSTEFDKLVNRTNCIVGTLPTIIKCLRNKTADELISVTTDLTFNPVFDRDFVQVHPVDIFKNNTSRASAILNSFGDFDFLIGVNSDEGSFYISYVDNTLSPQGAAVDPAVGYTLAAFRDTIIPMFLEQGTNLQLSNALHKALLYSYVDWKDTSNKKIMRQRAIDLMPDRDYNAGMITTANVHSDSRRVDNTFFYVYDHQLSYLPSDRGYDGANHGEEIPIVFGLDKSMAPPETPDDPTTILPEYEVLFAKQVMEYWTNFAKTGNPNLKEDAASPLIVWPSYDSTNQQYIRLVSNQTSFPVESHYVADRIYFWNSLVPALEETCSDDCVNCSQGNAINRGSWPSVSSVFVLITCSIVFLACALKTDLRIVTKA